MSPATLTHLLREKASALGFDLFGVVPVSRSETIEIYRAWLNKGYGGTTVSYTHLTLPTKA